jgi:hypothetical protein
MIREYSIDYPETCSELQSQVDRFSDGDCSREEIELFVFGDHDALNTGELGKDSEDFQGIRDIQHYIVDFGDEEDGD